MVQKEIVLADQETVFQQALVEMELAVEEELVLVKKRQEESKALPAENKSVLWSVLDLCNNTRGPTLNFVDLLYGHLLLQRSSARLAHLHPSCDVLLDIMSS
jgi:hypothetical protein